MLYEVITNIGITYYFSKYIQSLRVDADMEIVNYINDLLLEKSISNQLQYNLIHFAISKGTEIRILDIDNNIVLDSLAIQGKGMGAGRGQMQRKAKEYIYNTYVLENGDFTVNQVQIGHPVNLISKDQDKEFLIALNVIISVALVFAIIIAIFVGKKRNNFV